MKRQHKVSEKESGIKKSKKNIPLEDVLHMPNSTLHMAIRHSNYRVIDTELQKAKMLCSGDGHNCFHLAHTTGNWKLLQKLLEYMPSGALSRGPDLKPLFSLYPQHFQFLFEHGASASDCSMCLLKAVKKRSPPDLVQKIIDLGVSLDEKDEEGKSALIYALMYGDFVVAQKLISAGADIKAVDSESSTVLMYAILHSSTVDIIQSLVGLGADVSSQNSSGESALILACQRRDADMVQLMLNFGANVYVRTQKGKSPLIVATEQDSPEIIKILLAAGAYVPTQDDDEETALFKIKNEKAFLLLLEAGASPTTVNNKENSILMHLVIHKPQLVSCMKLLLDTGANASSKNHCGNTALMEACNHSDCEYLDVVKLLLEKGVNTSCQNNDGLCALSHAISWEHLETIKLLLSFGANPSSQDNKGISLLMQVCRYEVENVDILNHLIQAGANVSAQDVYGQSALIFAVQKGHTNFIKQLLQVGANPSSQNKYGVSALHLACDSKVENMECVNSLLAAGGNISAQTKQGDTALMIALNHGHHNIIKQILSHGANVCAQDGNGRTVLMTTCDLKTENVEFVKLFIEFGVSLSAQDKNEQTALMLALAKGHFEIINLLIEAGANVSTQDNEGNTLLMMACERCHIDIVQMLLQQGACVSTQNNLGETAVIIAAIHNHLDVVCLLLQAGASAVKTDNNRRSAIYYMFDNRTNNKIHADFELTLKTLCDNGVKNDGVLIVPEVVDVYFTYCYPVQDWSEPINDFVKQIIDSASKQTTVLLQHQRATHHILMNHIDYDDWFEGLNEIFNIMIQSPFKDVNWSGCISRLSLTYGCAENMLDDDFTPASETFTTFVVQYHAEFKSIYTEESYNDLWNSLQCLIDNGFCVNPSDPKVMSPLSVVVSLYNNNNKKMQKFLSKIANDLIVRGAKKYQRLLLFSEPLLVSLSQQLQLPDALWLAFQNGMSDMLPLLLPYWSAPPLALLMFVPSLAEQDDELDNINNSELTTWKIALSNALDTLLKVSGPLPAGHEYIHTIQIYLETFTAMYEGARAMSDRFRRAHSKAPPSLKQLSRHVIRGCTQSGEDLPQRLSGLVPPGLKSYLTLMDN